MATKTHLANRHHCCNLDDCRALLEQLGYHQLNRHSYENDSMAVSVSAENVHTVLEGSRPYGIVRLDKKTGELFVTDRSK